MDERVPLYLGHMLDTAREAVERAEERGMDGFVEDEDPRSRLSNPDDRGGGPTCFGSDAASSS